MMDVTKSQNDLNNSTNKDLQIGYEDLKNKLKILEEDNQKWMNKYFLYKINFMSNQKF